VLLAAMFCAAGAAPPVEAANDRDAGLSWRLGCAEDVTVKVTATVCGLLEAPVLATVTLPVQVPAAKPVGLTDTLTVPGVLPLAGVADSHVAEVVVDTV
jgi:hypothetical protein